MHCGRCSVIAIAACAALIVLATAGAAAAQTEQTLPSRPIAAIAVAPVAESPDQVLGALQRWTTDYTAWQAWFAQWRNTREPGWWKTRDRRIPPVPPAWLPGVCAGGLVEDGPVGDACRVYRESLRDLDDEAAALAAQRVTQARSALEAPQKTSWWSRVHLDGIWPMTRSGTSAFGVFGTHATMPIKGRFQVFLAPGVIVMRLPSPDGSSQLTAATDWGFSFRLTDFRLPGFRSHEHPALQHGTGVGIRPVHGGRHDARRPVRRRVFSRRSKTADR